MVQPPGAKGFSTVRSPLGAVSLVLVVLWGPLGGHTGPVELPPSLGSKVPRPGVVVKALWLAIGALWVVTCARAMRWTLRNTLRNG